MPVSLSVPARSAIVSTLRAAGCVFAEDEAQLLISEARTPENLKEMVRQRAGGLPIEQVVGWAEFCGLRIAVDPGVFVPRRRSEFLVRQATREAEVPGSQAPGRGPLIVVDLCCGSGAVGAALAAALDGAGLQLAELHAVDIDPAAVACARRNLTAPGARVHEGDLYEPLPAGLRGRVDVLVANAPYVPASEVCLLPPEARMHEPRAALDGGSDGLDVQRRVSAAAPGWLAPGGCLLTETSQHQAAQLAEAVAGSGLTPRIVSSGELNATVVIGTPRAVTSERGG